MGMKLKSGADLCGFELSRFCVQNDVAIPDAPASGRKYFHTGTGMEGKYSLLGRERIFTGTSWRAAAYVDDLANLDLATNADYLKLKEKVDLLSGEVDTDAIINNMKEVTAFLSGFAEDASLMDLLNSKFDKKGGTIETNSEYYPLVLATTAELGQTGIKGKIGTTDIGAFVFSEGNTYLYNYKSKIGLGIYDGIAKFGSNILLHSGNVGEYKAGEASVLTTAYDENINYAIRTTSLKLIRDTGTGPSNGFPTSYCSGLSVMAGYTGWQIVSYGGTSQPNPYFRKVSDNGTWQDWKTLAFTDSNVAGAYKLVTSSGADALLAEAGALTIPNAWQMRSVNGAGNGYVTMLLVNSANDIIFGYGGNKAYHRASSYNFTVGTASTTAMLINSFSNVTIGSSDLAGTSAKLYVDGNILLKGSTKIGAEYSDSKATYNFIEFNAAENGLRYYGGTWTSDTAKICHQFIIGGNTSTKEALTIYNSGNVLIGTTNDSGHKLQVAGHIAIDVASGGWHAAYLQYANSGVNTFQIGTHGNGTEFSWGYIGPAYNNAWIKFTSEEVTIKKNLVANGTIACKGVAAEGSAPVGTVDKWAGSIATGTKSQTYTHGLGTTDITVAIYEKNGNEWVQILTDVDIVNANSIRVTFGANTTVEHRIVVMG